MSYKECGDKGVSDLRTAKKCAQRNLTQQRYGLQNLKDVIKIMILVAPFLNCLVLCYMITVCIMQRKCCKWTLWNYSINTRKAILVSEFCLLRFFLSVTIHFLMS